jgi:hypothetical protein
MYLVLLLDQVRTALLSGGAPSAAYTAMGNLYFDVLELSHAERAV